MKEEDFVSFEVAKLLKEKGYNEPTRSYYSNNETVYFPGVFELTNEDRKSSKFYSAPTLAEAAKWLREVHNIYVCPRIIFESDIYREYSGENTCDNYMYWLYIIYKIDDIPNNIDYPEPKGEYGTYEEALNEGIKEALKL